MQFDDLDIAIEQSHLALAEIAKGNPEPFEALYSLRDDVTLGNPFGPFVRGRRNVLSTAEAAASRYRDGVIQGFEPIARHVSADFACVVEVERFRARVGGSANLSTIALRVTSIFRPEDGAWKLVHRHADPITTPQPPQSVVPRVR